MEYFDDQRMYFGLRSTDAVRGQYGESSVNYKLRWELYRYVDPEINIHSKAVEGAELTGDERILDVGCGDGSLLVDCLSESFGHKGEMVGIDKFENMLFLAEARKLDKGAENISFLQMDANKMDFEDNSFDAAFALFSLYHTNPEVVLKKLQSIIKPNGKLVVATSGGLNKLWHRQFEKWCAAWMTERLREKTHTKTLLISPPTLMNSVFNSSMAERALPTMFEVYNRFPPQSPVTYRSIVITPENVDAYYGSLFSMLPSFTPSPPFKLYKESIDAVVKPRIDEFFAKDGEFRDIAQRDIFYCINRK